MPTTGGRGAVGPPGTEGRSVLAFLFLQGFCPQWDLLPTCLVTSAHTLSWPSTWKWLIIVAFSLIRISLFCWFQSPIDLCHFLSPSLCASLDMAPGEFSGVYLSCLSVWGPFFPTVESRWSGVEWCSRDTPCCCHTPVTAGCAACPLPFCSRPLRHTCFCSPACCCSEAYFGLLP